jgi:hypothetical protein
MNKKIILLALLIITMVIYSCKKEPVSTPIVDPNSKYEKAFTETNFDCKQDVDASNYFKGKLNGKEICYYDGIDYHRVVNKLQYKFITNKPEFFVNGKDPNAKYGYVLYLGFDNFLLEKDKNAFAIESNFTQKDSLLGEYIEKNFAEGKTLNILDKFNSGGFPYDTKEGYIIELFCVASAANSTNAAVYTSVSTVAGGQSKDSYFKVSSLKKRLILGATVYDIKFDLKCELYKNWRENPELYGILEGQYVCQIEI